VVFFTVYIYVHAYVYYVFIYSPNSYSTDIWLGLKISDINWRLDLKFWKLFHLEISTPICMVYDYDASEKYLLEWWNGAN
jgi:hypothetical protein